MDCSFPHELTIVNTSKQTIIENIRFLKAYFNGTRPKALAYR